MEPLNDQQLTVMARELLNEARDNHHRLREWLDEADQRNPAAVTCIRLYALDVANLEDPVEAQITGHVVALAQRKGGGL
jgi:hypothetical protein